MPRLAELHLYPPQPPRRIQNYVIALVVGERLSHPKPLLRRIQHALHLCDRSLMLIVVTPILSLRPRTPLFLPAFPHIRSLSFPALPRTNKNKKREPKN